MSPIPLCCLFLFYSFYEFLGGRVQDSFYNFCCFCSLQKYVLLFICCLDISWICSPPPLNLDFLFCFVLSVIPLLLNRLHSQQFSPLCWALSGKVVLADWFLSVLDLFTPWILGGALALTPFEAPFSDGLLHSLVNTGCPCAQRLLCSLASQLLAFEVRCHA